MSASFINRELSWIEFNQRVLEEVINPSSPLLERLKFLAITGSNMDEFFQVRVGGLTLMKQQGIRKPDPAGLTPTQQLKLIRSRIVTMKTDQYDLLNNEIIPQLSEKGIKFTKPTKLPLELKHQLNKRYTDHVEPLLTPVSYGEDTPLPFFQSLQHYLITELDKDGETRLVFTAVPEQVDRFVVFPHTDGITYIVTLEDTIAAHISNLFPGEKVSAHGIFRITRNGDVVLQDEDASDLAEEMEDVLAQRKASQLIRLEIQAGAARHITSKLRELTGAKTQHFFRINGPIGLTDFMSLAFLPGFDELRDDPWEPQPSPLVDPHESMFYNISNNDIMLYHPYESFDPVVRMIEEAANDPKVLSIKQVLYRTATNSRIVDALIRAAENGKQVTVLIELKARFDEARNLQRADELHRAGVNIVYGVKNLKTHAKIAMIIRNEDGNLRRYMHLGTGNYNESTAKIYTDISLLTCDPQLGADASAFFNAVTGRSQITRFNKISPAPTHMKAKLLELIGSEATRAKKTGSGHIIAKVNSLQDLDIINALYKAAKAGVKVQLNIRGICCLNPKHKKAAGNIEVISVIDRYLEHARIFYFAQGDSPQLFISSADWMTRNQEKRVELMIPIEDRASKKRLIQILKAAFKDNQNAHEILADGSSQRVEKKGKRYRMQEALQRQAEDAFQKLKFKRTTTFEPHVPQEE